LLRQTSPSQLLILKARKLKITVIPSIELHVCAAWMKPETCALLKKYALLLFEWSDLLFWQVERVGGKSQTYSDLKTTIL